MEPSLLHLKSAIEEYLLAAEVLKPEADPRQLTIYAPPPGAPCEKAVSRTSVVLWLLGRWAEPSHKTQKGTSFKNSPFFSSLQNPVTGEARSHVRDITSATPSELSRPTYCFFALSLSLSPHFSALPLFFFLWRRVVRQLFLALWEKLWREGGAREGTDGAPSAPLSHERFRGGGVSALQLHRCMRDNCSRRCCFCSCPHLFLHLLPLFAFLLLHSFSLLPGGMP